MAGLQGAVGKLGVGPVGSVELAILVAGIVEGRAKLTRPLPPNFCLLRCPTTFRLS